MFAFAFPLEQEEEFLARVSQIGYHAVLSQGLRRPFLEVELDVWRQIRTAYHAQEVNTAILEGDYLAHVVTIARQAISRQGLRRALIADEADIGFQIRSAYESLTARAEI